MLHRILYKTFSVFVVLGLLMVNNSANQTNQTVFASQIQNEEISCESCGTGCVNQSGMNIQLIQGSDAILKNLRKSHEARTVLKYFGTIKWNDAMLMTREGNSWKVFVIPINSKDSEIRVLLAGTQDGVSFRALVFGMEVQFPKKELYENVVWSDAYGSLNYYSVDGITLFSGEIADGVVLQKVEGNGNIGIQSAFSDCFINCVVTAGTDPAILPACTAALLLCAAAPTPINPGCITLVACIGGAAFFCLIACI
jgi:hypothetical protein